LYMISHLTPQDYDWNQLESAQSWRFLFLQPIKH
jgi:hypothetical protein